MSGGVQRNANGIVFDWLMGASPTRGDLVQRLLNGRESRHTPQRIALLVKNLNLSGGNRVIFSLFDRLQSAPNTEMHVFVVPEIKRHIKEFRDLFACKRRYGAAASVTRATRPVDPSTFDMVISTSRRTLDFVLDLASPAHVHLLQAIEAWDTLNSPRFREFCRDRGYPTPEECVDLVRSIGVPQDVRYLDQISSASRILTVSEYMASAIHYAGRPEDVIISEPALDIRGTVGPTEKTIDVLLFVRGDSYNGDALALVVANALPDKYRITVVAAHRARAEIKAIQKRDHLSIIHDPSDAALAKLFASARVVIHPSLHNGAGFIPQEALSFGCAAVASRTGWLFSAKSEMPLIVVDRHDPEIYLSEVLRVLDNAASRRL